MTDQRVRDAIARQYHAAFAMLRQVIEDCPEDLWVWGKHPRTFWRVAYHAIYYADMYLSQTEADFVPWEKARERVSDVWDDDPDGVPPELPPYAKSELIEYVDHVDAGLDSRIMALDLETADPGFHWYSIPKLDHVMMNFRHLQHHVGQLNEHLHGRDLEIRWYGRLPKD